jgi:hypothetical protein
LTTITVETLNQDAIGGKQAQPSSFVWLVCFFPCWLQNYTDIFQLEERK